MAHPRTQIRNAFVNRLTDATEAEERVYAGRLMPIEEPELPAAEASRSSAQRLASCRTPHQPSRGRPCGLVASPPSGWTPTMPSPTD